MCPLALVAAVTLTGTVVHGAVSRSTVSAPSQRAWIAPHKGAFGLVQQVSRGGAATKEEEESKEEEGEPVELYLPGLLETAISKTKKVRLCLTVLSCCRLERARPRSNMPPKHHITGYSSYRFDNYSCTIQSKRTWL